MNRNIKKITPFFISSLIAMVYAIRNNLFNFWTLKGGESLIGIIALAAFGISTVLFFIDRLLIRKFKISNVYLIELLVLFLIITLFFYNNRRLICRIDDDVEYFIIVYGIKGQPGLSYSFPFNKSIRIEENGIYLTNDKDKFDNLPKITGQRYNSRSSKSYEIDILGSTYNVDLITINDASINIDSLEYQIRYSIKSTLK